MSWMSGCLFRSSKKAALHVFAFARNKSSFQFAFARNKSSFN